MKIKDMKKIAEPIFHYPITESEIENMIDFIHDCLVFKKKETEINEPYAIKSINNIEIARQEVYDLSDIIWEDNE